MPRDLFYRFSIISINRFRDGVACGRCDARDRWCVAVALEWSPTHPARTFSAIYRYERAATIRKPFASAN